jgi:methionyl-tRNA formyltransferase
MPEKLNIVFMGTPEFAVPTLQALIASPYKVVAVYSQPPRAKGRGLKETPSPVHQCALEHGIPVYTPVSLKSPETQAEFAALKADIAVVVAYGLLLPQPILSAYPLGCINVHPSLLPRWRGAAPIQRTVMAGDKETGIVIMQMDKGLDTGDMLLVSDRYRVEDDTAEELHDALAERAGPMVLDTLDGLKNGTIKPRKQPEAGVTYAKKITKDDCRIKWRDSAASICNQIRGLYPRPGAFFMYKGEAIKIFEAQYADTPAAYKNFPAGTLLDEEGRIIVCGDGVLFPMTVQRPGKKPMSLEEMLRGHPIPGKTQLE